MLVRASLRILATPVLADRPTSCENADPDLYEVEVVFRLSELQFILLVGRHARQHAVEDVIVTLSAHLQQTSQLYYHSDRPISEVFRSKNLLGRYCHPDYVIASWFDL